MKERTVVIEWDHVWKISEVLTMEDDEDFGLYQIVGFHSVYGNRSLLYIGKAQDRPCAIRIREQLKEWVNYEWEIELYIGCIKLINDEKRFSNQMRSKTLSDAEKILIYFQAPSYNSKDLNKLLRNYLRVINVGYYGQLFPEVSKYAIKLGEKVRPRLAIYEE